MIIYNSELFTVFYNYLSLIKEINAVYYINIFASKNWHNNVRL